MISCLTVRLCWTSVKTNYFVEKDEISSASLKGGYISVYDPGPVVRKVDSAFRG